MRVFTDPTRNTSQVYDPTRDREEYIQTNVSQYTGSFDYEDYSTAIEWAKIAEEWAIKSEESALRSEAAADASEISAINSENSAIASEESADKAKASEITAGLSAATAILAAIYAEDSKDIAQGHVNAAKEQADRAEQEAIKSEASSIRAQNSAAQALVSETNAKESEENAKTSEEQSLILRNEAAESANNAQVSAAAAGQSAASASEDAILAAASERAAAASAAAALDSEQKAKASEDAAKVSETNAKTSEDNAKVSETNAKESEVNAGISEDNAKESEEEAKRLLEEFQKGSVYRGAWNPMTNAYPAKPATNSQWDVYLDEGVPSHDFDGKIWRPGDRLVFGLLEDTFYKIGTFVGVSSVNGLTGAVTVDWVGIGGNDYIIKDVDSKLRLRNWLRAAGTSSGFLPRSDLTGADSVSVLGTSTGWFKEAWVNTYNGGSVKVNSVTVQGNEVFSPTNKPTWSDVGGDTYWKVLDGHNTSSLSWIRAGNDEGGYLPASRGTGSSAKSYLGEESTWWFKEAWVNSYRGGSVSVAGSVSGTEGVFQSEKPSAQLLLKRTNINGNVGINFQTTAQSAYFGLREDGKLGFGEEINLMTCATFYTTDDKPNVMTDVIGTLDFGRVD